ncbi:hypothetical protein JMA_02270 [Jeotgalibacillus malaysiensis]|uniref:ABC transporter domain-containing protein n=1 Tax=Jeotgalibacillus malaysiensis TaxID=1508404 RepID=A0A0B5ANG9_9BACL|nr:ABC transporter ATP-binding protein [Jeotgalibacillus malaysiensis]AJD89544.1 hypothetical protein JMA_02270 [Jeotgalibacillus malaysiensis]
MILRVSKVQKSYGKEKVLKNISFEIQEPKIVALIGPNGSGKSTLLSIITNLIQADRGDVEVFGESNRNPHMFKQISFMQDNTVLYDYLTGYDHLQFIGDAQGIAKKDLLKTAERIGITDYLHKKVKQYSLGMKQHLLLALAIVNQPKLLILDEPLNGLDPTSAIRVRNLLLDLAEKGTTILLSSHNLGEIDRVTSHILFLKDGELLEENLSDYQQTAFEIETNQPDHLKEIARNYGFKTGGSKGERVAIILNGKSVSEFFEMLSKENMDIRDMEKKVFGSEERYQRLFNREPLL